MSDALRNSTFLGTVTCIVLIAMAVRHQRRPRGFRADTAIALLLVVGVVYGQGVTQFVLQYHAYDFWGNSYLNWMTSPFTAEVLMLLLTAWLWVYRDAAQEDAALPSSVTRSNSLVWVSGGFLSAACAACVLVLDESWNVLVYSTGANFYMFPLVAYLLEGAATVLLGFAGALGLRSLLPVRYLLAFVVALNVELTTPSAVPSEREVVIVA